MPEPTKITVVNWAREPRVEETLRKLDLEHGKTVELPKSNQSFVLAAYLRLAGQLYAEGLNVMLFHRGEHELTLFVDTGKFQKR